jgi:2-C-methyl-D-erythritol 4-phosphate cytidylyltransferase
MDCGIVLSSGTGERFGTVLPKQYNLIGGSTVVSYPLNALLKCERIQKIIVTVDKKY